MGILARGARKALVSVGRGAVARKVGPAVASGARPVVKSVVRVGLAAGDGLRPLTTKARQQWKELVAEVRREAAKPAPAAAEEKAKPAPAAAEGRAERSGTGQGP
jgi:hypothetical protein